MRQQKVHNEYKVKAHNADKDFNDFDDTPNSGPVATRLSSFGRIKGLVSGAFGEGSTDLHDLCEQMASSAASHRSYELGARTIDEGKSRAKTYIQDNRCRDDERNISSSDPQVVYGHIRQRRRQTSSSKTSLGKNHVEHQQPDLRHQTQLRLQTSRMAVVT